MVLLLVACSSETAESLDSKIPNPELDWRSMLDSLPTTETVLASVELPQDIRTHAEQLGESFEARWAMTNKQGQSYTAFVQLDRLKLKEDLNSESSWSYSSVARAIVVTGKNPDTILEQREVFSRVALGLADSRGDEFFVGNSSLSLGQGDSCKRTFEFSHNAKSTSNIALLAKSNRCPSSASLGTINQWEFEGIRASGIVAEEEVEGFLWLTHRWGSAANVQSAVVLDQLRLVVQNSEGISHWLNVTRSKRRSGRGPKTILASLTDAQGIKRNVNVEWFDSDEVISPVTGNAYPETISIKEATMDMNMVLSPVVGLSEIRDSLQTRWSGALEVSGSHTGLGYLDFMPIKQKER